MSQNARARHPAAANPSQREIMNYVGVGVLLVITLIGCLCVRFVEPNQRAFVYGKRALTGIDGGAVFKWPEETADYIELKTYSYSNTYLAVLRDGKYVRRNMDNLETGAEFRVSFDYELYDLNDAAAKVIHFKDVPLQTPFNEGLDAISSAWFTEADLSRYLEEVAAPYPVRIRNVSVQVKERNGPWRIPSLQLIGNFVLDSAMPLRFSTVLEDGSNFAQTVIEGAYGYSMPLWRYIDIVFGRTARLRARG